MDKDGFLDRERAHVFLHRYKLPMASFALQPEEVAGMVTASFADFCRLWQGDAETIRIRGFRMNGNVREPIDEMAGIPRFVPHDAAYYLRIIEGISDNFA
ncbi:hypothetical protein D3C73_1485140 [compost metagenome]